MPIGRIASRVWHHRCNRSFAIVYIIACWSWRRIKVPGLAISDTRPKRNPFGSFQQSKPNVTPSLPARILQLWERVFAQKRQPCICLAKVLAVLLPSAPGSRFFICPASLSPSLNAPSAPSLAAQVPTTSFEPVSCERTGPRSHSCYTAQAVACCAGPRLRARAPSSSTIGRRTVPGDMGSCVCLISSTRRCNNY